MTTHRRQESKTSRRIAAASALAVGATVLAPTAAHAATINVPQTDLSVQVPGVDAIPGVGFLNAVPGGNQLLNVADQGSASFAPAAAAINPSGSTSPSAPAAVSSVGQQIVNIARTKIGSPYVYGAAGPNAFDCSGFTSWVYSQVGKSIPRTSQAQASSGTQVSYNDLQPGDIVAFYGGASHVGIYIGNGMIIDALNSGTPVGERPLDYMPFHSAVRF
ncbi:C40 family peptidase [Corynebacterium uberis]|uniref:C40 family peptidase n=1 Tax=Corynebacterium TaxID=1716 RepID=UPI001D0ABD9E|nr:C40 family peptidase [Corynebacterium uberis]MCZ9308282.1 C40 family peptidase [Corynebacterium sp. c6VSa_13]UDL73961.1 C40 family peptidase [Corynebacterium uberis]UDL75156.1 C40 family peptidase [Corynebacterium uberis]UDL77367.1 C40 family peptidase [Corynebacterium uberis]UDL79652.1 C40 family peptidase [Corynebacterium uberis]